MQRRLILLRLVVVLIFALILGRLVQLQIIEGRVNRRLSDENRIRVMRRLAPRGLIYDRHGRVLAGSRLSSSVGVFPEELRVLGAEDPASGLASLLGVSAEEVRAALEDSGGIHYEPTILWRNADPDVVARVEEHAVYLAGVSVLSGAVRHYPYGSLAGHVLGFVREISPEELARPENAEYRSRDLIGKEGVERVAERALRGVDGGDQVEVDASGRRVRTLGTVPPWPGGNVFLTLDLDLQQAAEEALGERAGAVVAMDPWTGEVLAMASHPAYDPNVFTGALTPEEWSRLSGPEHPQQNRATSAHYPPGSVFKVVTAAAALEAGVCDVHSRFRCTGALSLGDWTLHCWKREGHGDIDFMEGIAQSCNVMFATLGRRIGPEDLADMALRFGMGEPCGIDLPQEAAGLVPTPRWKRNARSEVWYPGDTCQMAIGQGDCLVTPLQVACAFAVVANGGDLVRPHVIARIEGEATPPARAVRRSVGLRRETIAALQAGLEAVVAPGGTAHGIATEQYRMAGKTGTAQAPAGEPHAWFAGYAPAERPQLVIAVVVEHGGAGSAVAAPIARHVFDTALLPPEERRPWERGGAAVSPAAEGEE